MLRKSRRSQSEIYRKTNRKFGFAGGDSGQCVPVYLHVDYVLEKYVKYV